MPARGDYTNPVRTFLTNGQLRELDQFATSRGWSRSLAIRELMSRGMGATLANQDLTTEALETEALTDDAEYVDVEAVAQVG